MTEEAEAVSDWAGEQRTAGPPLRDMINSSQGQAAPDCLLLISGAGISEFI